MSEPFIGEVRLFGGNFAPRGWALCDGQLLAISQNDALFSIIGTSFGGDGRTTFGLPDFRGRAVVHAGTGPGLSNRQLGQKGGSTSETLTVAQMPPHTHSVAASTSSARLTSPSGQTYTARSRGGNAYGDTPNVLMDATVVGHTGGSQSHENRQPYTAINYIIALFGIYPLRN